MNQNKKPALIFTIIGSLIVFYLFNRTALVFNNLSSNNTVNVLENINQAIGQIIPAIKAEPLMISTSNNNILIGIIGASLIWFIYLYNVFGSKNYMRGKEHGTARWGTRKDIKPLINKIKDKNIPLSATEQISVDKMKKFEADRNKNIVVIGGSGSGKTYSQIKPSLMQLHSSYVITDPKGTILPETGHLFKNNGYDLRAFNTIDFTKSLHYNPLAYIRKEKDILKVVNVFMENTKGEGANSGDKFWQDCEKLLYTAFIAYLWSEAPAEDQNIPTMIEMLEMCEVKEDDEDHQSPIDIIFEELEEDKPDCLAVKQYKKFKAAAGKTLKSILISCAARLAPFDIDELKEITKYDELKLDEIGDRKTAFFVIMSDTDSTYAFLIAMIMYQMFNLLCEKADNEYGGKLPFQVRCLLDEFANIGKIPDFEKLISTIRSRNISCMIILQSLNQITSIYKESAEIIIDCCDTMVFLGGKSTKTTKQISEMIGKTTIDSQNINESKGQTGSYSLNNAILGRDLIDPSEIGRLKRTECLVLITGLPPFKSKKYNTKKHKRFKEISDGGTPLFDIRTLDEDQDENFFNNITKVQEVELTELNALI